MIRQVAARLGLHASGPVLNTVEALVIFVGVFLFVGAVGVSLLACFEVVRAYRHHRRSVGHRWGAVCVMMLVLAAFGLALITTGLDALDELPP